VKIVVADPAGFTAHYDANLCHALAERGNDVSLDTSPFLFEPVATLGGYAVRNRFFTALSARQRLNDRPSLRRLAKGVSYPVDVARWARAIRRFPPDVVHLQWSLLPLYDVGALASIKRAGPCVVYTVHDVEPFAGSGSGLGSGRLYRAADALVVHSELSRQQLVDRYGVPADRVHHVPLGGPGLFAPAPVAMRAARDRLALLQDATYLLFFGLIKRHKGLDVLLDALAAARDARPDLRLLIAGEPMERWEPYARQIERRHLEPAVDLRLGFVPSNRLADYFCAADLVVLPYRQNFQSGVALAAYTYARPVLATTAGGLPELVVEGETGFLTAPDDPAVLAQAIVDATADREALTKIGAQAAARLRARHGWKDIAERHEQIYASLAS
jgi:glycosyltransferase involved in cell wall biosynthesis